MEDISWSNLPIELLELILSCIPLSNHPYFASVCKSWKQATFPIYSADSTPLLLHIKKWTDNDIHYYSPLSNITFKVNCPFKLPDSRLYFAKDGWLVMHRTKEVVLANPISNVVHRYPNMINHSFYTGISFLGCPPDKCTIFAINGESKEYAIINVWKEGEWSQDIRYRNNVRFKVALHSSPVVFNKSFWCLGEEGDLGVYMPYEKKWRVYSLYGTWSSSEYESSYMTVTNHKLTVVLFGHLHSFFRVLRFNQKSGCWEEISKLGMQTIFVGMGVSLTAIVNLQGMKDSIVLSRFHHIPETISADIVCCAGRIFFVPKLTESKWKEEGLYSVSMVKLKAQPSYDETLEYPCCIWYEARV